MTTYKFKKKIIIKGKVKALTGLAIGGSNAAMSIGGVDKGVLRNPINGQPYIPGSTLKGKMRSLLEIYYGEIGSERMGLVENTPTSNPNHHASKLFGNAVREMDKKQRPSRAIVRDAPLDKKQIDNKFFKNTELPFTEVKTEVVIDRVTSRAMPRQMERVPAGAKFKFQIVLNIFEEDNETELVEDLFRALSLVQSDYIGGSGSRGSGQIEFNIKKVVERTQNYYENIKERKDEDKTEQYSQYFPK